MVLGSNRVNEKKKDCGTSAALLTRFWKKGVPLSVSRATLTISTGLIAREAGMIITRGLRDELTLEIEEDVSWAAKKHPTASVENLRFTPARRPDCRMRDPPPS